MDEQRDTRQRKSTGFSDIVKLDLRGAERAEHKTFHFKDCFALFHQARRRSDKSLAKQLAKQGIRVDGVAPGPAWTPLQISGGAKPEKQIHFGAQTPLGRAGMPGELAGIYVLLADNQASFATGQIYGSSGGAGQP